MKTTITLACLLLLSCANFNSVAQVTIGSDINPNSGALLDIKQMASTNLINSTKGLNFPRVALQASDKLEPCATTNTTNKSSHRGLVVYHTDNAVMKEGLYYWNGNAWRRLIDEIPPVINSINLQNLRANSETILGTSAGTGGAALDFGELIIPETGSYAFNFRFYGPINNIAVEPQRCVYYLSVWAGAEMRDIAEINLYAYKNTAYRYTYSVALGAHFTASETVTFKMSHMTEPYSWTLGAGTTAARTSMIWWKL